MCFEFIDEIVADVNDILESSLPRVARWPRSWYIGVATQAIRSGSGGVSRVFHIPGPTPNLV